MGEGRRARGGEERERRWGGRGEGEEGRKGGSGELNTARVPHPAVGPLLRVLSAPCCEAVSYCGAGSAQGTPSPIWSFTRVTETVALSHCCLST